MKPFKIAILGDGMTEKWGPDCRELRLELQRLYNRTEIEIENHGLVGTRAGYGLYRVTHDYKNAAGSYQPCVSYGDPSLVIIESFAYTNSDDDAEGLTEYRDVMRRLYEEVQRTTAAKILFYITIPPEKDRYLESTINYFNTSKATRRRMADRVILYLDEAQNIAADEGWPVANVYADVNKKIAAGDMLSRFINQSDNVHPSTYGYEACAKLIVRTIDDERIITEAAAH